MKLIDIINLNFELLSTNRTKKYPFPTKHYYVKSKIILWNLYSHEICHKKYGSIDAYLTERIEEADIKKSKRVWQCLEKDFSLPFEMIIEVFEFIKWTSKRIFNFLDNNHYNRNTSLYFLCQMINFNANKQAYNLRNFLRHSFASSDLWKRISYMDGEIRLVFNEMDYSLFKAVSFVLKELCPDKFVKVVLPIFKHILVENASPVESNISIKAVKNDYLSKYMFICPQELAQSPKKYLKLILACTSAQVSKKELNLFVSRFILNNFLHDYLAYDITFLKRNEYRLKKYSKDQKILTKLYTRLYNLNLIKNYFWSEIEDKKIQKKWKKYRNLGK